MLTFIGPSDLNSFLCLCYICCSNLEINYLLYFGKELSFSETISGACLLPGFLHPPAPDVHILVREQTQ